jgi:hypothetical protein
MKYSTTSRREWPISKKSQPISGGAFPARINNEGEHLLPQTYTPSSGDLVMGGHKTQPNSRIMLKGADDSQEKQAEEAEREASEEQTSLSLSGLSYDDDTRQNNPGNDLRAGNIIPRHYSKSDLPEFISEAIESNGKPIDKETQKYMGSKFEWDFSNVRVHSSDKARESAKKIDAQAYTVGNNIVFGEGHEPDGSTEGRSLLAHELTHVVQQQNNSMANIPVLQRKGGTFGGFFANLGRGFVSIFSDELSYSDETLAAYLKVLNDTNAIEDDFDSDDKARAVVRKWRSGSAAFSLTVSQKILLIREVLSGVTGDDDEIAILDIVAGSSDTDLKAIFAQLSPEVMQADIHGAEEDQFKSLMAGYHKRTDPLVKKDVLEGTHAVTPTEHVFVESVLNPGSTLVTSAPPPPGSGASAPPPVLSAPPVMTGLSPSPGVPGAFQTEMTTTILAYLKNKAASFKALKADPAQPAMPIQQAGSVAIAAQKSTESYFSSYIRVASRTPEDEYIPGAYSLISEIGDQSTVPITDDGIAEAPGVKKRPGRKGWMQYWMTQDSSGGAAIMDKYHCLPSRSPDSAEFSTTLVSIATNAANRSDIDDAIHSWPAEASGGVNIQPYQDKNNLRAKRWDLYTTLLHEMMHILAHPNYKDTYGKLSGSGNEILKEGMSDVMRRDLWDGPGNLKNKIATDEFTPLRRQVEGGEYDYDPSVVIYHQDYGVMADALKIVKGDGTYPGVGIENAKAAFFMGHTELLGLGTGTAVLPGVNMAGVANYSATESADAFVLEVQSGDTFETIRSRTNAGINGIKKDFDGTVVNAGAPLAVGMRLRIPGIRFVYSIKGDTIETIAAQNGVTTASLITANKLEPDTPSSYTFSLGSRVLIPIRTK